MTDDIYYFSVSGGGGGVAYHRNANISDMAVLVSFWDFSLRRKGSLSADTVMLLQYHAL